MTILERDLAILFPALIYSQFFHCLIMYETRIELGRGILKNLSTVTLKNQETSMDNIWDTIEDFGIQREHLKRLNPSYQELFEIYSAIRAYRISVNYLKELKKRFA